MFGRFLLAVQHLQCLLQRHIEHADLTRGRQIPDLAPLQWVHQRVFPHGDGLERILEFKETAREVWTGIALQLEGDRFSKATEPNLAAHAPLHAIVNFTTDYVVMNSPCHEMIFSESRPVEKRYLT